MAAERLSKLQKWILVKCYQKTIKRDNSGFTILKSQRDCYGDVGKGEHTQNLYWGYLFRDEILTDYYKYPEDEKVWGVWAKQHAFKGDTAKGRIAIARSLDNLEAKGLIEKWVGQYMRWQGVKLTEAGIAKALMLSNVRESNEP